jgi:hypothetical protein
MGLSDKGHGTVHIHTGSPSERIPSNLIHHAMPCHRPAPHRPRPQPLIVPPVGLHAHLMAKSWLIYWHIYWLIYWHIYGHLYIYRISFFINILFHQ